MRLIRVALANLNTTVGAVRSNVDQALAAAHAAARDRATLVCYPEQTIGGYPQEDLVQWTSYVEAQWHGLEHLARETSSLDAALAVGVTVARGPSVYNCVALVHRGRVHGLVPKEKLPTYNVFYEGRTFARGGSGLYDTTHGVPFGDLIFDLDFGTVAVEVCEDLWSPAGPMRRRCYAGAEIVLNVSASPYRLGIQETRRELLASRSGDNLTVVAYTNLVGANDGLIFDGGALVASCGRLAHEAPRFTTGVTAVTVDLDRARRLRVENTTWRVDQEEAGVGPRRIAVGSTASRAGLRYPAPAHRSFFLPTPTTARDPRAVFCDELLDALALGVGDYYEKVGAWKTIGVALSGGRDSLLTLIIARRFIDRRYAAEGVAGQRTRAAQILRAFFMPTRYSSPETRRAAEVSAAELGVPLAVSSIDAEFESELAAVAKMLQPGESLTAAARQNVQARLRAERMWTWSNASAGLFLQTSNMSEKAAGYSTIGGDGEGALAVIANLPKTLVNYLLDYLLETTGSEAIRLTLLKPASAELAEDMEDEKDLMPFTVLDACFALYAGEKMSPAEVARVLGEMFPEHPAARIDEWTQRFARLFNQSIYKWVQAPLSLHVGNLDLERERALQLPVVQSREWQG